MWSSDVNYDFERTKHEGRKAEIGIKNIYISRATLSKYSLELPLGAKALITLHDASLASLPPGKYILKITDISGKSWDKEFIKK